MSDSLDNKSYNAYNFNPYSQMDYYKRLEQENLALKEQMRQQQFVDPIYAEFQQSAEYQEAKKNNVLTFLLFKFLGEWQNSNIGKQFVEWDNKEFENYKAKRSPKTPPSYNPNSNNVL